MLEVLYLYCSIEYADERDGMSRFLWHGFLLLFISRTVYPLAVN